MIATGNSASRTSGLVDHSSAASEPELTIIVVTWNTRELTLRCLETLFDNTPDVRIRVIVADNNSEDGSADVISERFPQVHLIRNNDDFGFARANNEAMTHVDTEWALLLNPDTETHPNAIRNLLDFSKQHQRGRNHRWPGGFSRRVFEPHLRLLQDDALEPLLQPHWPELGLSADHVLQPGDDRRLEPRHRQPCGCGLGIVLHDSDGAVEEAWRFRSSLFHVRGRSGPVSARRGAGVPPNDHSGR